MIYSTLPPLASGNRLTRPEFEDYNLLISIAFGKPAVAKLVAALVDT